MQTGKIKIIAIIAITCAAALSGCRASGAASMARAGVEPYFKSPEGLALQGHDSVAYFTDGKPVQGSSEFELEWHGATWRFATAQNRDLFLADPEKYAPQYGGYCAWAVGHGYTAKGDPEAWKVVDGKLYLNYNQNVKAKWEQDIPGLISKGDENWTAFLTTKPEHKGEGAN